MFKAIIKLTTEAGRLEMRGIMVQSFSSLFKYGLNCSIASVACCTSEESLQSFNLFSLNKETYSQQDSQYEIQRAVTKYHKLLRFSVVFILQKPRHFSEGDPPKGSGTKV